MVLGLDREARKSESIEIGILLTVQAKLEAKELAEMELIYSRCAGLDVHKKTVVALLYHHRCARQETG